MVFYKEATPAAFRDQKKSFCPQTVQNSAEMPEIWTGLKSRREERLAATRSYSEG
jgi:hypothetical protein